MPSCSRLSRCEASSSSALRGRSPPALCLLRLAIAHRNIDLAPRNVRSVAHVCGLHRWGNVTIWLTMLLWLLLGLLLLLKLLSLPLLLLHKLNQLFLFAVGGARLYLIDGSLGFDYSILPHLYLCLQLGKASLTRINIIDQIVCSTSSYSMLMLHKPIEEAIRIRDLDISVCDGGVGTWSCFLSRMILREDVMSGVELRDHCEHPPLAWWFLTNKYRRASHRLIFFLTLRWLSNDEVVHDLCQYRLDGRERAHTSNGDLIASR